MLLFSPLTVRERKLSPYSLKCGFGKLRMFTVDLKGMQFFFFFPVPALPVPDPLVVGLPSPALLSHPCNAADIMTTRRNEIRNLKGGCGCLVISCEEGEEKQDPSLIRDFIL